MRRHRVESRPECRWGDPCPIEAQLHALAAEAWEALEQELDDEEERPSRALALLVCAVVLCVGVVAAWLAVLWVLGGEAR